MLVCELLFLIDASYNQNGSMLARLKYQSLVKNIQLLKGTVEPKTRVADLYNTVEYRHTNLGNSQVVQSNLNLFSQLRKNTCTSSQI